METKLLRWIKKKIYSHSRLFDNIERASSLKPENDFSFFKNGIQPAWEDTRNCGGGTWTLSLPRPRLSELDNLWLELVSVSLSKIAFLRNRVILLV